MKTLIAAATALVIISAPAFAGGYGHSTPTSPQFANASAMNYVTQKASIAAFSSKGQIKQVTGANAEALNQGNCGCAGAQTAYGSAKNMSVQIASIKAGMSYGSISQSSVATASAMNFR